jgi:hypothetical protein
VERVIRWGTQEALRSRLEALGWRGVLQTAFVERVNLTLRRGLAMLARQRWATTETLVQLQDEFTWWRGYYRVVKPQSRYALSWRYCETAVGSVWRNAIANGLQRWRSE